MLTYAATQVGHKNILLMKEARYFVIPFIRNVQKR